MLLFWALSLFTVAWINKDLIHMPPVWDAAPGVFAPAIYLYETGFHFQGLFSEPSYIAGGPNVHSTSLITLLTASVFWLTNGSNLSIPILHWIQFAFSAIILTSTYYLAIPSFNRFAGGLLALTILAFPVFLVQTGYLYTEILGATLTLLSLCMWVHRKYAWAIFFAFLACLNKSLGIPIAGSLALLIALDTSMCITVRTRYISTLFIIIGLSENYKWTHSVIPNPTNPHYLSSLRSFFSRLAETPDLLALIYIALVLMSLSFLKGISQKPSCALKTFFTHIQSNDDRRLWVGVMLYTFSFLLFMITAPLSGKTFMPLVRYYVWVLPLLMFILLKSIHITTAWTFDVLKKRPWPKSYYPIVSNTILITTLALFSYNRNGTLYPHHGMGIRQFSVTERSLEYQNFYEIQKHGVESVANHAQGMPTFVTRGEYYFISHPLMGYVSEKIEDVRFIARAPYNSGNLEDFPLEFMLLDNYSNSYHGQNSIQRILKQAKQNNSYKVAVISSYINEPYRTALYKITAKQ